MLEKCTTMCRVLFLLIIIMLSVYFIYTNEKKQIEKFELGTDYKTSINQVMNTLLGREATEDELTKYQSMMKSTNDTKEIVSAIAGSVEYRSTMGQGDNNTATVILSGDKKITIDFNQRITAYRDIMYLYESTLNRLPSKNEVDYYTYSLVTDKTFSIDKLRTVLESSQEYTILIKNQTNLVNAQLSGEVSDAQLTFVVRDAYKKVFDTEPSEDVERFLKRKLMQYNMNDIKFNNLLLLLKTIDQDEMIITENKDQSVITIKAPKGTTSDDKIKSAIEILSESYDKEKTIITKDDIPKENKDRVMSESDEITPSNKSTVQNIFNIINPSSEELDELLQKASNDNVGNKGGNYFKGKGTSCSSNYKRKKYIDDFYDEMEKINYIPTCDADLTTNSKQSNSSKMSRDRNLLAEYTTKRNMDELKLSCARNTYAMMTEEAVSSKKNDKSKKDIKGTNYYVDTKPTFGTFLEEADNTKVGSIMPKFIYKEYDS